MGAKCGNDTTNSAQEGPAKEREPWRDERGRYLPGNPGGPGNPVAREMARMRLRLMSAVSDEVFDAVVRKLVSMSLEGHLGAMKLLLAYRAGKPDQTVRADDLAADEVRLAVRAEEQAEQYEAFDLPAPPAGRPEQEWRRAEPEARRAVPPAGSRPFGPEMQRIIDLIRATGGEAMAQAAERAAWDVVREGQWGPTGTVADTSETTAEPAGGVAPGGGAAGGWR